MAISPINAALKNSYNLSFEANKKHKQKSSSHNNTYMTLKAIPLATLMAMAPMNEAYSQNVIHSPETTVKISNNADGSVTKMFTYPLFSPGDTDNKLIFLSTDGDDKPEELKYIMKFDGPMGYNKDGVRLRARLKKYEQLQVRALKHRTFKSGNNRDHYEIVGRLIGYRYFTDRDDPSIKLSEVTKFDEPDCSMMTSEEMYNLIKDSMGDKIEYIEEVK